MWLVKARKKVGVAVAASPVVSSGLGLGLAMRVRHVVGVIMVWMMAGGHLLYLLTPPPPNPREAFLQQPGVRLQYPASGPPGHVAMMNERFLQYVRNQRGVAVSARLAQTKLAVDDSVPAAATGQQLRRLADVESDIYTDTNIETNTPRTYSSSVIKVAVARSSSSSSSGSGSPGVSSSRRSTRRRQMSRFHLETRRSSKYNVSTAGNVTDRRAEDPKDQLVLTSYVHVACRNVSPPNSSFSSSTPSTWQEVTPGQSYVFSAFYDPRPTGPVSDVPRSGLVRVIGITDTRVDGAPQFCHLWYRRDQLLPRPDLRHGDYVEVDRRAGRYHQKQHPPRPNNSSTAGLYDLVIVPVISDIVPETHGLRFAPFLYTCRLPSDDVPVAVSLVHRRCEVPRNYVFISNKAQVHSKRKREFTVCVTPLNFNYSNVNQLVEYIEVGRLFGAQKYVFYNHSSGPLVSRYMKQLRLEGLAEVIQWDVPVQVDTWPANLHQVDIHYFGQLAALNDCLYRNMFTSNNLVFIDLDEMIVPKRHGSWGELVKYLRNKSLGGAGAYIFQNVFFRTEWADDPMIRHPDAHKFHTLTLLKTKHERYLYPWGIRSKYICDPLKVELVGVHNIWRFINDNLTELDVPSDVGLLHHYRSWQRPQDSDWSTDRTMHLYHDVIVSRVRERHEAVTMMDSRDLQWSRDRLKGRAVL